MIIVIAVVRGHHLLLGVYEFIWLLIAAHGAISEASTHRIVKLPTLQLLGVCLIVWLIYKLLLCWYQLPASCLVLTIEISDCPSMFMIHLEGSIVMTSVSSA